MKVFFCNSCGGEIFFENTCCLKCGSSLGFDPILMNMVLADSIYKPCQNAVYGVCNWLLPSSSPENFCISCATNKTIPNLNETGTREKWQAIETAKHRVFYSLLKLRLNFSYSSAAEMIRLEFEFLESYPEQNVVTGHSNGLITLNISEADPVERTRARQSLNERYRTLVGHFRHELGHFYWMVLIASDDEKLQKFRDVFGDERIDYGLALKQYYHQGAKSGWQNEFVSEYASAHPWEDWAETWAHYMHIMDTAETANSYGLKLKGALLTDMTQFQDVYIETDISRIIKSVIPLFVFANSLNNGMGQPPFYPFQITNKTEEKIQFIHSLCLRSS
jgi:hypothetical protein